MHSEFWGRSMLGKPLLEYKSDGKMTLRYLLEKCVSGSKAVVDGSGKFYSVRNGIRNAEILNHIPTFSIYKY
jgi:hypothetical protein